MNTVRLGLVGMGPRGQSVIRALKLVSAAEIAAVCDTVESLRTRGAGLAEIGEESAYHDIGDMLARDDIDAVGIWVATELQPDLALQALTAGKHVICSIPLAYSLDDCWKLVLAVERSGLTLALDEQLTYAPFLRAWQRLVEDGTLGKIVYAEAEYVHGISRDWYWVSKETGEYIPWELAHTQPEAEKSRFWRIEHPAWYNPHCLTPLLHLLQERVVEVACMSTRRPSYHLEEVPLPDLEVALMRTERDTIVRVTTGFVMPAPHPWLWFHLHGTKGQVETARQDPSGVPTGQGSLFWLSNRYMPTRAELSWDFTDEDPPVAVAMETGHAGLDYFPLYDFIDSVAQDRTPTIDVYRAAEVAAAGVLAGRSAEQSGVPLPVPDFRPGSERGMGEDPSSHFVAAPRQE